MNKTLITVLQQVQGFEWDGGNEEKNWLNHQVSQAEAEQVFFNTPLILAEDKAHSQTEKRYSAFGRTNKDRKLFIVFTVRNNKIRVISARDQDKQERGSYEQTQKAA
jgi:hypothetical protein